MQKALVVLLSAGQLCAGAAAGQAWAAGSPAHSIDPCYQALSCSLAAFLGSTAGPTGTRLQLDGRATQRSGKS